MATGILVALPEELSTLTSQPLNAHQSFALSADCKVMLTGMGSDNAQLGAHKLIQAGCTQLISWGCAGALAPHLKSGDLIMPKALNNAAWQAKIINHLTIDKNIVQGALYNSKMIIHLALEKHALHTESNAVAVDMESHAIADIAKQHQLPFLALRCIVDPANFDLPYALAKACNAQGQISIPKLLAYIMRQPAEILPLIRLGLHFNAAKKTLTQLSAQLNLITQQA